MLFLLLDDSETLGEDRSDLGTLVVFKEGEGEMNNNGENVFSFAIFPSEEALIVLASETGVPITVDESNGTGGPVLSNDGDPDLFDILIGGEKGLVLNVPSNEGDLILVSGENGLATF